MDCEQIIMTEREREETTESRELPANYPELLHEIKDRIQKARVKAALSVNRELILLYWEIGRRILESQEQEGWGAKVIDRLAADLRKAFPDTQGFSARNLKYMRAFAEAYPDRGIVQQAAAQIPWFHNCVLLDKVKDPNQRIWYIQQTLENGWSRAVLVHQIESDIFSRQGQAITNFRQTLPAPQSDLAGQLLKDPYSFDFLGIGPNIAERELEKKLIDHLKDFLIELGKGFALVGSQYHLEVGGQDYYLDLLFYHLRLRCFVVIDLKVESFKPEFVGKMNFYLSAVDDQLRHEVDNPTIGLLLCKDRNQIVVEYALRELTRPVGVATYRLTKALPQDLKNDLPTPEQLEEELEDFEEDA